MKRILFALALLVACKDESVDPNPNGARNGAAPAATPGAASNATLADAGELRLVCPKKAPFDTSVPGLAEQCTKRVLVAGLDKAAMKISFDDGASFTDAKIDAAASDLEAYAWASGYGVLVAMTRHGVYTSSDATTWTKAADTDSYNYSGAIAFANGRFAVSGTGGSFGSDDGVTWLGYKSGDHYPSGATAGVATHAIGFLGSEWFLAGDADGNAIVRTSKDGLDWSANADIMAPRTGSYVSIATTTDHAVVVGGCCGKDSENVVAPTTDLAAWTPKVDATGLRFVASDGMRFVGYANKVTYTSTDGASWTKLGDAPALEGVVFAEGLWFGRTLNEYFTSTDAVTWASVLKMPTGNYGGSVGFGRILK